MSSLAAIFGFVGALGVVVPTPGRNAELRSLARGVPAGVAVYLHSTPSDAAAPWTRRVRDALEALAYTPEELALVLAVSSADEPASVDPASLRTIERMLTVVSTPDWSSLLFGEWVAAARVRDGVPEFLAAFRVEVDATAPTHDGFRAILAEGASGLPGFLRLEDRSEESLRTSRLSIVGSPLALSVQSDDGVVVVTNRESFAAEFWRLRQAESGRVLRTGPDGGDGLTSWIETAAYRDAFAEHPATRGFEVFVDVAAVVGAVRHWLPRTGPDVAPDWVLAELLARELSSITTYSASVSIDGDGSLGVTRRLRFAADSPRGLIEAASCRQPSTSPWLERVRAIGGSWAASRGVDWTRVHDTTVGTLRASEAGRRVLSHWSDWERRSGWSLRDDLLSWWDGSAVWVVEPTAAGGGGALVLRTRNRELSTRAVSKFVDAIVRELASRGQRMTVEEGTPRTLRLDAFPDRAVVVHSGEREVIVATSRSVFDRLVTPKGDEPSAESTDSAALSVSVDLEDALPRVADALAAFGFIVSMTRDVTPSRLYEFSGVTASRCARALRALRDFDRYEETSRYDPSDRERRVRGSLATSSVETPNPSSGDSEDSGRSAAAPRSDSDGRSDPEGS